MNKLNFHTASSHYETVYAKVRQLSATLLQLHQDGWVWSVLGHAAARSLIHPLNDQAMGSVEDALVAAAQSKTWAKLVAVPLAELTVETVAKSLEALEQVLRKCRKKTDWQRYKASSETIRLFEKVLKDLRLARIDRLSTMYHSRIQMPVGSARKMISDLSGSWGGYPISAIPHENASELRIKYEEKLKADLDGVKAACKFELESRKRNIKILANISAPQLSNAAKERLKAVLRDSKRKTTPKWVIEMEAETLLCAVRDTLNDSRFWLEAHSRSVQIPRSRELEDLLIEMGMQRTEGYSLLNLLVPQTLCGVVFIAVLNLIQAHSGWNASVGIKLQSTGVRGTFPDMEIQSFKSKVQKTTPPVLVDDETVAYGIQLLLERLNWYRSLGWVDKEETRLWLNHKSIVLNTPRQIVGWASLHSTFTQKAGLPKYSLEMLRVQKLNLDNLVGGISAAQETGNHASINTSGRYTFQDHLVNLEKSKNLEFQRQLEDSIEFAWSEKHTARNRSRRFLFVDVGDGVSCDNPQDPPELESLINGKCSAEHCHENGGCKHRKIFIDEKSLDDLLSIQNFYRQNWKSMFIANAEGFRRYHATAMIFNEATISFIDRGPFAAKLRTARQGLVSTPANV